jgi:hypothetical protein
MSAPKQQARSTGLVRRFTKFVERRLSILVVVGIVVGALATFTGNLDKLIEFTQKHFRSDKNSSGSVTTQTQLHTGGDQSSQVGGGNFAGFEWRYVQGRGLVHILEEKITLFTHRAEALTWIDSPERRDFRFSCAMELVSGDTSLGFGPVFWLQDERNFFHFAVRTAGHYRLLRYRDGKPEELIPWTPSQKVRHVLTRQTLEVVAKENRVDLSIDGATLRSYELPAEQTQAGHVGVFAADGGLTVDVTQVRLEP